LLLCGFLRRGAWRGRIRGAARGRHLDGGIAVILGAEAYSYPVRFRQSPDLYDLTA
jgi:hypothetical protein